MKQVQYRIAVRQQGAATLVVVMVLFLVMALLAAYANRGLLFEQRIASSYARAGLSQEVAEGGIEWTLAQLNGPAIDDACKPQAVGGQRFVDKYLRVNPGDRSITPTATAIIKFVTDCTRDLPSEGWICRCPAADKRTVPVAAGGSQITPSFGVKMSSGSRGGTVLLDVIGCTDSVADTCGGKAGDISRGQQAKSDLFPVVIALVSAVRTPPAAPLIVKGDLSMTGTGLGLHNTDPRSAGSLLAIGGAWSGLNQDRMQSVPGTATTQVLIQGDQTLSAAASGDLVFKMFMGATPSRYKTHPSLRTVTCNGDCAGTLQEAYAAGKRILWVDGPLTIRSNKTIGSVSDPVLIIATDVTLENAFQINGMLVARGDLAWTNAAGVSLINGAVLVTGNMHTTGSMDIAYQQAVADQLRNRMGSYVRVPGGWVDKD